MLYDKMEDSLLMAINSMFLISFLFISFIRSIFVYSIMRLIASHIIPEESAGVAALVKEIILQEDQTASVILFGSRARGDAEDDSDWDFLVLTKETNIERLSDKLRKLMLRKVELRYETAISLIVKNVEIWKSDYSITNIFDSITDEGILL